LDLLGEEEAVATDGDAGFGRVLGEDDVECGEEGGDVKVSVLEVAGEVPGGVR
jgi:hypothetical protein